MNIKDLESKKLPDLREIAKAAGIKKVETFKKSELVDAIKELSSTTSDENSAQIQRNTKPEKAKVQDAASEIIPTAETKTEESIANNSAGANPIKKRKRLAPEKVIIGAKQPIIQRSE